LITAYVVGLGMIALILIVTPGKAYQLVARLYLSAARLWLRKEQVGGTVTRLETLGPRASRRVLLVYRVAGLMALAIAAFIAIQLSGK
jgi:hypothetical protein